MTRWTVADIAAALGLQPDTVHSYKSRGQMPAPSGRIGRTPYWTERAIAPWIARQLANRKYIDRKDRPDA